MVKALIILVIVIILGIGVYYGRFLFTKKVVREEAPAGMETSNRVIKEGNFTEIDFIHKGSGKALIIEDSGGRKILRLENFQVTNGPDLYVYLSKNPAPSKDKESLGDFINLGRLKGNVGDQNYEISQDIEGYNSVIIWCRQFSALFSFATLK